MPVSAPSQTKATRTTAAAASKANAATAPTQAKTMANLKICRAVFKVTSGNYNFKNYDSVDLSSILDERSLNKGITCYNLCSHKGQYRRYHADFEQSFFFSFFPNTPDPCSVFVFIEILNYSQNEFSPVPHQLTIAGQDILKPESIHEGNQSQDYELYYAETQSLNCEAGSLNDRFIRTAARYIKATSWRNGHLIKPNAFATFCDGRGMAYIKHGDFAGFCSQSSSFSTLNNTLLPLCGIIAYNLAHKHELRYLISAVSKQIGPRLNNADRLYRKSKRNLRDLNRSYCRIESNVMQNFLIDAINPHNVLAKELSSFLATRFDIKSDYEHLKEQQAAISHLMNLLSTREVVKGQFTIRLAILTLGLIITIAVVAVASILGVEPMVRLLINLGIVPEGFLK